MEEKLNEFEQVRKEVGYLIGAFPKTCRNKILFDKWSLKDIVGHLSNWMVHDIDCLTNLKKGVEPYWEPDVDDFNLRGVTTRKDWSWEKVVGEFGQLGEELTDLYKTLPDVLWDVPIWKKYSETARKFVQEDIDHWKNEHTGDLKEKLHLMFIK
jgi:hypothetical protein